MDKKWDVRTVEGKQTELQVGRWYVGMNWLRNVDDNGAGEIAQYVGDDEFYDEGCDEPVRMQDYEYLLEQA